MADGRDDAADQLKQWKSQRGSQVPAGRGRSPVPPCLACLGERGAPRDSAACGAPSVPGAAAEGEAPSPRPGLAPTAGRCSRERRGTERWRLPAGPERLGRSALSGPGRSFQAALGLRCAQAAGSDSGGIFRLKNQEIAFRFAAAAEEPSENVTRE